MKIYEFDFASELNGSIVKEKTESLYQILMKLDKESKIRFIVASPEILTVLECFDAVFTAYKSDNSGDLTLAGRIKFSEFDFACYKTQICSSEIVVFHDNDFLPPGKGVEFGLLKNIENSVIRVNNLLENASVKI
jgi:hypothetical protein